MANQNWQNFLFGTLATVVGYAAQKVATPNTASWAQTRSQIYAAGLQSAAQQLQDMATKIIAQQPATPTPTEPTVQTAPDGSMSLHQQNQTVAGAGQ